MKNAKTKLTSTGLVVLLVAICASAQSGNPADVSRPSSTNEPDAGNLRAFIELARSDIRTQKTLIIAQNLTLTADEAVEFWPVHREYDGELNRLLDRRLQLINEYLGMFDSMTDKQAETLAKKVFDLEEERTDLKRTWFKKFAKVITAKKAAQFFQIENQLNAALDLRIAASLPLIR